MKKKIIMALLAGTVCVAATGCSSSSNSTKETKAATTEAATTEADTTEAATTEAATTEATTTEAATTEADTTEAATTEADTTEAATTEADTTEAATTEADTTEADTTEAAVDLEVASEMESESESGLSEEESETTAETEARVEYEPSDYVTLGEYTGLDVEIEPVAEVTDEAIDEQVQNAITSSDLVETVEDGEVQNGDTVNIDYVGTMDGEEFDGGTAEGYDLTIGSNSFIDGFEAGLVGLKTGEETDLNLTFPEDYTEDMAGKDVSFHVTVNSISRYPEMSDEVASELSNGDYKTVDEYRSYIKDQLAESYQQAQDSTKQTALLSAIEENCEITGYPQDLIDQMLDQNMDYYSQYAEQYGTDVETFFSSYYGMTIDQVKEQLTASIQSSLDTEIIYGAIAEKENITLTDDEYQTMLEDWATRYGYESSDEFEAAYGEDTIRVAFLNSKVNDWLMENNNFVEIAAEAETEGTSEVETEAVSDAETQAATEVETESSSETTK